MYSQSKSYSGSYITVPNKNVIGLVLAVIAGQKASDSEEWPLGLTFGLRDGARYIDKYICIYIYFVVKQLKSTGFEEIIGSLASDCGCL